MARTDNDAPRGSEWNPMTNNKVRGKFRRLAAPLLPAARLDAYLERVERLETSPDSGWVLSEFAAK